MEELYRACGTMKKKRNSYDVLVLKPEGVLVN
jgi:hypothetical protein